MDKFNFFEQSYHCKFSAAEGFILFGISFVIYLGGATALIMSLEDDAKLQTIVFILTGIAFYGGGIIVMFELVSLIYGAIKITGRKLWRKIRK